MEVEAVGIDIISVLNPPQEELKPCPFCGREVKVHGGEEEWRPTFYDPDSGGDPYHIDCECGCCFIGSFYEYGDIVEAWNTRVN